MSTTQYKARNRSKTSDKLIDECLTLCRQAISELQSLSIELEHSSNTTSSVVSAMYLRRNVQDLEDINNRTLNLIRTASSYRDGDPIVRVEGQRVKPGTTLFGIKDNVAWKVTKVDSLNVKYPIQAVKLKDNNIVRDLRVEWLSLKHVFLSKDRYAVDVGSTVYVGGSKAKAICKGFESRDASSGLYHIVGVKYQDGIFEYVPASDVFFRSGDSLNIIASDIIQCATNPEKYVKDKHLPVTVDSNAHTLMMEDITTRLTELEEK